MEKMKNVFSKIVSPVKETFSKYPATIVLVYILTAFIALIIDTDVIDSEMISHVTIILLTWCIGVFCVETYLENKKSSSKFFGLFITLAISIIFDILAYETIIEEVIISRIYFTYIAGLIIFTLYKLINKSELDFKEYVLKIFANFFYVSIVYLILNIGVAILSTIFIVLILDGEGFSLLGRLLILLLGIFYVPAVINSLVTVKNEESKFFKKLLLYVLLPLVVFASLIIYLYIIKLFVNGEVVKNEIFAILACMFVASFPICIMARNYKESKLVNTLTKIIMFSYIPFVILQIYAMNLRVSQYGLTGPRYLAYWFIIIECIIITLSLYKDSKYMKNILPVLFVIIAILLLTPLNPGRISALSQKKILDEFVDKDIDFDDCTKKEKLKYSGAYDYLYNSEYDEYINEKITKDDIEKMNEYNWNGNIDIEFDYDYEQQEYIYLSNSLDGLDISKYSKIYDTSSKKIDIDIEEYAEKIIKEYSLRGNYSAQKYFANNSIIELDEYDVFISSINISYYVETEEIIYVNYKGYVLEK